jgi:hypothetical protein
MLEVDRIAHTELGARVDGDLLVSLVEGEGARDRDVPSKSIELLDACLVDEPDERGGAAVEDRDLFRVELDPDVVDAEGVEGGEQVLGRADPDLASDEARGMVAGPR